MMTQERTVAVILTMGQARMLAVAAETEAAVLRRHMERTGSDPVVAEAVEDIERAAQRIREDVAHEERKARIEDVLGEFDENMLRAMAGDR